MIGRNFNSWVARNGRRRMVFFGIVNSEMSAF